MNSNKSTSNQSNPHCPATQGNQNTSKFFFSALLWDAHLFEGDCFPGKMVKDILIHYPEIKKSSPPSTRPLSYIYSRCQIYIRKWLSVLFRYFNMKRNINVANKNSTWRMFQTYSIIEKKNTLCNKNTPFLPNKIFKSYMYIYTKIYTINLYKCTKP